MSNTGGHIRHRVRLGPDHKPTGNTRHTVAGIVVEPPSELRIVQFDDDPGWYLIHLSEKGEEITDTYHDSCEEAMEQAEFEFGIKKEEWS